MLDKVNFFLRHLEHNYALIAIAAILFFLCKAAAGYLTYKHYDKKFKQIESKLDELIRHHK
ncbi:hypothetical protein CUU66_22885 [Peribacillus deserti]|uniref:Uncharacterized protein n=1 Tax=Peribacillus deserti TaxID=673318 RepID=A0A2N5LZU4_9BACI|nr:hypothetical protein CUU66_22885 [Peribacillus deserti]